VFSDVKEGKVVVSRAWRARLSPRPVFSFVLPESRSSAGVHYIPKRRFWAFSLCWVVCVPFLQRLGVGLVACMYVCRPSSQVMSYGRWIRKDIMLSFFRISILGLFCWNIDTS
jgi:hypothetical protein